MNKRILCLGLALCFITLIHCQSVIILNPGCKQYNTAGSCVACSNRFYKDAEGICQPVNPNCKTYKNENGACTSCFDGFAIIQDVCLPKISLGELQGLLGAVANCNALAEDGTCKKCSQGYYFDQNRICKKIPDTCMNFDISLARCVGCYQGYALNNLNECVISSQTTSDLGCNKFQNGKCVKCSLGYYFGKNGICKLVPPSCQNFDTINEKCSQCYPGYGLDNQFNCIQSVSTAAIDPGCSKFQNGKCVKCSFGFYFDKNRICKMIPPTCSNFNTISQTCSSCYPGYVLDNNKQCVQNTVTITDLGCSKFEGGFCVKCSIGYYFNKNKICRMIPPTCGSFDPVKQVCNACYPGYALDRDGNCIVSTINSVTDLGCNSFENGICVRCSFGYYFDKKRTCKMIPPTCSNFDTGRQICLACYPGYTLDQANSCIESASVGFADLGCAKFDNAVCVKCSVGYYFDKYNKCKITPPSCSIFDSGRQICLGCYPGYSLDSNKTCVRSVQVVTDMGCNKFENGRCVKCSVGYYFNMFGQCMQIPPTCNNFDTVANVCKGCFPGYQLNFRSQCIAITATVSDPNCKQFKNGQCMQCSQGAYFNAQGKCVLYDSLCRRFNIDLKRCEQCYPGFSLNALTFVCKQSDPVQIDINCKTIKNNQCIECSFRYYKGPDGKCKQVDPNCRLYNSNSGECSGCYEGYKLVNRNCEKDLAPISDLNCAEWKNGMCMRCAFGSYFGPSGVCTMVDPLCMTWDDRNGACKSCYPSYEILGLRCVPSKASSIDQNCAQFSKGLCTRCSKGFYFNSNNICTQVDPLCQTFDSKFGRCLSCFGGYKLDNGRCLQDMQSISDINCAQFKNSVCIKCSIGYYFDKNKRCKAANPQCRIFDTVNERCSQCYPGYTLVGSDCLVSNNNNLCADWKQGICLRCANRAYYNEQGSCTEVNVLCNQFDIFDGECKSCYNGFELLNGNCIKRTQQSANGCVEYNSNNECLRCQKRRYLVGGVCQKIDDYCDQFNFIRNVCTRCYSGYSLANGKCIVSEVKAESEVQNCFTYSLNGACVECFDRYYLKNNQCKQVNVFCKKYDVTNGDCIDCYGGFKLELGKCLRK